MNPFLKGLTVKKELDIPLIGVWSRTYGFDHNLSFQKLHQDPDKHGAIIVRDTKIFLGADDEFSHLSLSSAIAQQNKWFQKQGIVERVIVPESYAIMEFVSYNTNINKHDKLSKTSINNLAKYALYREQGINQSGKKIKVVRVDGTCKHIRSNEDKDYKRGDRVSIQTSQYFVKDHLASALEEGYEGVWIIASQYCQRSFTVGSIYIVMLSYDAGGGGRTNQCISRLASPLAGKDAGLVISNSFNGARDEKIDLMLNTMIVSRQSKTGQSYLDAGKEVKRGLSIFSMNDNGTAIQWEMDEYLYRLATQKTSHGALVVKSITSSVINSGLAEEFKLAKGIKSSSSKKLDKTFDSDGNNLPSLGNKLPKKEENAIRDAVQNLVENAHLIQAMGSCKQGRISIKKSVKNIVNLVDLTSEFMLQFNLKPEYLYILIDQDKKVEQELETMVGLNITSSINRKNDKLNNLDWSQ